MALNELMEIKPYSLVETEKPAILTQMLTVLTVHHYENCREYRSILDGMGVDPYGAIHHYEELPMLPVRMFRRSHERAFPRRRR